MEKVAFRNEEEFKEKVSKIKSQGLNSLHIISDFDLTLTKEGSVPTWEVCQLGDEYEKERDEYKAIYLPIEYDVNATLELKNEKMNEWWKLHLGALIKYGLNKQMIDSGILHSRMTPRDRLNELCEFSSKNSIPFLVLSAGLGDVINEFFLLRNMLYQNMHIVSNFFTFGENGKPIGFKGDIVHSYNKSETHLRGKSYAKEIEGRKNVILLGDSPGDVLMIEGIEHENVIKIGFLNGKQDRLEAYKELYDVVITEDAGVVFVLDILNDIK